MKRVPRVSMNWADKVVCAISPTAGLKRYRSRLALEVANAYTGASRSRRMLSEWTTTSYDADTDILSDLPALRERSRDLVRNDALAAGAINCKVTSIVGTGLKLQSRVDRDTLGIDDTAASKWERKTETLWGIFCRECDIERSVGMNVIQELALRSMLENGDVFALLPYKKYAGNAFGTKIQLIEADRVCNANDSADTATHAGGVRKDEIGAVISYDIMTSHPGNQYSSKEWKTYPAFGSSGRRNVLHLYRKIRVGQTRGVPDLAPVIEMLKSLSKYSEASVTKAAVEALFTVFVKTEDGGGLGPDIGVGGALTDQDIKLGSGTILDLAPGEEVQFANPASPNPNFDPFVLSCLRQIGSALEIPVELLIKHFTASYSASKAALDEAWRFFRTRRQWLIDSFLSPVYETWMMEAVASGIIDAPGFLDGGPIIRQAYLAADWMGDPKGNLDPMKEAEADGYAEDRGWVTAAQNTASRGGDFDRNHRQRAKEVKMRREAELEPPLEVASAAPSLGSTGELASLKETFDSYGVGVRAGAITPQISDERHYRSLAGLPDMENIVIQTWADDGGVRRPITLQAGDAFDAEQQKIAEEGEDDQ